MRRPFIRSGGPYNGSAYDTWPRLLLLCALCLGAALYAEAQAGASSATSACASCHRAQSQTQPLTPMGRALQLPGSNLVLKSNPKLTVRKGPFSYTVETIGDKSTYSVTDGTATITLPIHFGFGTGGQSWILERNGQLYESLVSYYPTIPGLDTTIGDERIVPKTLEQAVGRELAQGEIKACFGCHASDALSNRKLNLDTMKPGVNCEHCHTGTSVHLLDALQGEYDSAPPKLGSLPSEDIANFCGKCHRTWEGVVRGHFHGEINVRFQPYRLSNSRCFDGTDPRISCVACHDPHQDVVREDSYYDSKCLACHAAGAKPVSATTDAPKPCPVAKENCVSCHMPKVLLPGGHMKFTDHEIRVVKAGEPYPN